MQLKSPPSEMKFRIISDSKKEKKIGAYSVWISKKPFLSKLANLKRREEVEFVDERGNPIPKDAVFLDHRGRAMMDPSFRDDRRPHERRPGKLIYSKTFLYICKSIYEYNF